MIVVSPWSRGGWVNSQLFDHTSMIRFLEARFAHRHPDLVESNITPWRRAVVGDLTTAFDFRTPNASPRIALPSTDAFKPDDLERHPDQARSQRFLSWVQGCGRCGPRGPGDSSHVRG